VSADVSIQTLEMGSDGGDRQAEPQRDLFIGEATRDQDHDLALPRTEVAPRRWGVPARGHIRNPVNPTLSLSPARLPTGIPLVPVTSKDVAFESGSITLRGYLALPDGVAAHPGVVVIHEAFGLNEHFRNIARRFAAEGYAALAVDLFSDRNRAVCMARFLIGNLRGTQPFGVADLGSALEYLGRQPEVDGARIGAIGFCLGGSFAIAWARHDGRLRAVAPFYGTNPRPIGAIRRMCPVVGSYPGKDFTARSARRLDAQLERIGVIRDIKIYPGTRHSFFNDQGRTYDPAASTDAWQRTLRFFAEHVASVEGEKN
jgi:carboxymethylenebutenolidase